MWRSCKSYLRKINKDTDISILTFVRSDAFKVLQRRASDPDKIEYATIYWDSPDMLLEIIKKRMAYSIGESDTKANLWDLLEPGFTPKDLTTFLKNNVLNKPRDYIIMFQGALFLARSKGQKYLRKNDFANAMVGYSDYVLNSLSAESQPYINDMMNLLMEFIDSDMILQLEEVYNKFHKAGISKRNYPRALTFLIESNFLGYGIDDYNYSFPTTPTTLATTIKQFQRRSGDTTKTRMLKIHNAFHDVLSIKRP